MNPSSGPFLNCSRLLGFCAGWRACGHHFCLYYRPCCGLVTTILALPPLALLKSSALSRQRYRDQRSPLSVFGHAICSCYIWTLFTLIVLWRLCSATTATCCAVYDNEIAARVMASMCRYKVLSFCIGVLGYVGGALRGRIFYHRPQDVQLSYSTCRCLLEGRLGSLSAAC